MNSTPFFVVPVRRKRDLLVARQKARQVAHLLRFEAHEEACVAAGAFAVACQAFAAVRGFDLCFHIDQHQLVVEARANHPEVDCRAFLKLAKPLPPRDVPLSAEDLAFMLPQLNQQSASHLFEEIARQNQEVLALLHELRQAPPAPSPSAA